MTKKAVHAMNPKCNRNGSTDADKYPGHASADSDSMGTVATSPLITFFLLLRFKCSSTLTEEDFPTLPASLDLERSADKNTTPQLFSSIGAKKPNEKKV